MAVELTEKARQKHRGLIKKRSVPKEPIGTGVEPQLTKLDYIRAVLFDVYGTILISGTEPMQHNSRERQVEAVKASWNALHLSHEQDAPEAGVKLLHKTIKKIHRHKKAQGTDYPEVDIIHVWTEVMRDLEEEGKISGIDFEDIPALVTDFVTRYDQPWLMPALQPTLDALRQNDKLIGIISNSQFYSPLTLEALAGRSLEDMGFHPELLFWSFAEDIAKPSVGFYEIARRKLIKDFDLQPQEMLFVGNDMLNDVYPAQQAGFKTALFAGDQRSLRLREDDERCQDIQPDITITNLSQILECLG